MSGCSHEIACREVLFDARDYVTGRQFAVAKCRRCSLVITDPQPSADELSEYYPSGYYGSAGMRRFPSVVESAQRLLYSARARAVERLACGPGRVLDIGCGRGHLLDAFRRRGWQVQGTELSRQASAHARDVLSVPVHVGPVGTWPWPEEHFDAVTLWHVLEHWREPAEVLDRAERLLRPGGALMIGVPNVASLEARVTREKWFHLDVPRHLVHLSPEWLESNVEARGFEVTGRSFFAPEYDLFSFVQSALNRAGLEQNLLYDILRGREAKVGRGSAHRLQRLGSLVFAVPLGLASVPATLLAGITGQGSSVTVFAVKIGGTSRVRSARAAHASGAE